MFSASRREARTRHVGYGGRKTGRPDNLAEQALGGRQRVIPKEQVEGGVASIRVRSPKIPSLAGRRLPRAGAESHDAAARNFYPASLELSSESQSVQAQNER